MNISETIHSLNSLENELHNLNLIDININSSVSNVNKISIGDEELLLPIEVIKGLLWDHRCRVLETRTHLLNHLKGLLS